jgi:Ca2+-binding RTX toxin-like protein
VRLIIALLAAGAWLALPGTASATVSCSHVAGTVTINAQTGDNVVIGRANNISNEIAGTGCAPNPTTANTTLLDINYSGAGSLMYEMFFGQMFGVAWDISGGGSTFRISGSPGSSNILKAGTTGIDTTGDTTPEIIYSGLGSMTLAGNGASTDTLSTAGGGALGGAVTIPAELDGNDGADTIGASASTEVFGGNGNDMIIATGTAILHGNAGNDTIFGGETLFGDEGDDHLSGGFDNDDIRGGSGDDVVIGGAGNDTLDGGDDFDIVSFEGALNPISADLRTVGAQDTGDGNDTFENAEGLSGSPNDDVLVGAAGADTLEGAGGDDQLMDEGGADHYDGGGGTDAVLYIAASTPVTADLAAGSASTGGADDILAGIEGVTGGSAADTLRGSPGADRLVGGAGNDTLDPRGGTDTVDGGTGADSLALRDGAADAAVCGDGIDSVVADRDIDALTGCENVDVPPPPPPPPPPACTPVFDIPGNGIDEDCDGIDDALLPISTTVANAWTVQPRGAKLRKLQTGPVPAGTKITLTCKGTKCPLKRKVVKRPHGAARVNLLKAFGKRRTLRAGNVLTITIAAPNTIAKRVRFTVRRGKTPRPVVTCKPPGGERAAC